MLCCVFFFISQKGGILSEENHLSWSLDFTLTDVEALLPGRMTTEVFLQKGRVSKPNAWTSEGLRVNFT